MHQDVGGKGFLNQMKVRIAQNMALNSLLITKVSSIPARRHTIDHPANFEYEPVLPSPNFEDQPAAPAPVAPTPDVLPGLLSLKQAKVKSILKPLL